MADPTKDLRVTSTDGHSEADAGKPAPGDLKANGQHSSYWILTEAERGKGFVRPVRNAYKHLTCGSITTMAQSIAETYARDPKFYGATFCATCRKHLPVGENGEFVWKDSDEKVGS